MILLLQIIWLFLPAAFANMTPVFVRKINLLNCPLDFGNKFRGKRIFGKNKTWRGMVAGIVVAIIVVYIQSLLNFKSLELISYDINLVLFGGLMGAGALIGDAVESFFKRQLNIKEGESFIPFDQIDWVLGSILFVLLYVDLEPKIILLSLIIMGVLHPAINLLGYFLKIKKNKF